MIPRLEDVLRGDPIVDGLDGAEGPSSVALEASGKEVASSSSSDKASKTHAHTRRV